MEKIKNYFLIHKKNKSDINEHLDVLYEYSLKCEHITEMGIRWGSSTFAFLYSNPKKMIGYDVKKTHEIQEIIELCMEYKIDFRFIQEDVLNTSIEETDLLFIDTLHTYNQLSKELSLHSKKVKKYIIMHDTTCFGYVNEGVYEHASELIKNEKTTKEGLVIAIQDFLSIEDGLNWEIDKILENNNGLTILKRK